MRKDDAYEYSQFTSSPDIVMVAVYAENVPHSDAEQSEILTRFTVLFYVLVCEHIHFKIPNVIKSSPQSDAGMHLSMQDQKHGLWCPGVAELMVSTAETPSGGFGSIASTLFQSLCSI